MFRYISFSNEEQFSSKFFEESFFCVPNYIIISLQVTSPRTMKTTISSPLSRSSNSASGIPVAFQVHPADLPRKFQQYFKLDRPSSLIQQETPPGHKFTLAQGLVLIISIAFPGENSATSLPGKTADCYVKCPFLRLKTANVVSRTKYNPTSKMEDCSRVLEVR